MKGRPGDLWAELTWGDLEAWAGGRSVARGRTYQRQGRVKKLAISATGRLLATVAGGERYTSSVWFSSDDGDDTEGEHGLQSRCTCPVGYRCKHAVAAVAEYLEMRSQGKIVPAAPDDDPRWAQLEADTTDEAGEDDDEGSDEMDAEEGVSAASPRGRRGPDQKIRKHIESRSREELVELVWSLTERSSELRDEFLERIALSEGNVDRLLKEARRELQRVSSQPAWRDHWKGEGYIPDYGRLCSRLQRLIEIEQFDALVPLGREIAVRGLEQVSNSHDEGETAQAVGECLALVFQAVARSSLRAAKKILFAIETIQQDDYDVAASAADAIIESKDHRPADWSEVADKLAAQLAALPLGKKESDEEFSRNYQRDRLSGWVANALSRAGRDNEVLELYEREARVTNSYERLVKALLQHKRYDDAERWSAEGIARTNVTYPGIASHLADVLGELAQQRRQWDVVAAVAAWHFFDRPGVTEFKSLMTAADKAGCGQSVRDISLRFLETGVPPVRARSPSRPAPRAGARRSQGKQTPKEELTQQKPITSADWPLPVPDALIPLLPPIDDGRRGLGEPNHGVLIDLAIAEGRLDDAIQWYERMQERRADEAKRNTWYSRGEWGTGGYGDRVAAAVAKSHPQWAARIYTEQVRASLTHASQSAYEVVASYLGKLRPILASLDRENDWSGLVGQIREQYRNRPRLLEVLDRLEPRPIVQQVRRRGGLSA